MGERQFHWQHGELAASSSLPADGDGCIGCSCAKSSLWFLRACRCTRLMCRKRALIEAACSPLMATEHGARQDPVAALHDTCCNAHLRRRMTAMPPLELCRLPRGQHGSYLHPVHADTPRVIY